MVSSCTAIAAPCNDAPFGHGFPSLFGVDIIPSVNFVVSSESKHFIREKHLRQQRLYEEKVHKAELAGAMKGAHGEGQTSQGRTHEAVGRVT